MDKWYNWIIKEIEPMLIFGMQYLHYVVLAVLLAIVMAMFRGYGVKKLFNVPFWCVYISSDLGGNTKPFYINKKGVCGAPDAVFFNLLKFKFIVGEYKSRNFNDHVKRREYYQVLLYVGLVGPWFLPTPKGFISYGCGQVVSITHNKKTFKKLLALKPEIEKSKKDWSAKNTLPLHKRS